MMKLSDLTVGMKVEVNSISGWLSGRVTEVLTSDQCSGAGVQLDSPIRQTGSREWFALLNDIRIPQSKEVPA